MKKPTAYEALKRTGRGMDRVSEDSRARALSDDLAKAEGRGLKAKVEMLRKQIADETPTY